MININRVKAIIEERKNLTLYDEPGIQKKWCELLNALGDDEDELYNFLKSIDDDTLDWIDEVYEELEDKFNSDRIANIFIERNKVRHKSFYN